MTVGRRSLLIAGLACLATPAPAQQQPRVLDSLPRANAVIDGRSSAFYVRFDRPVDHEDSRLAITRDGKVVELLHPRLESAPEVLFGRAPTLAPGSYTLRWKVGGAPQFDGEIPFKVE